MSIIFVGSVYPKFLYEYLLKIGVGADFAANNYQSALLQGLSELIDKVDIVSAPPVNNPSRCDKEYLKARLVNKEDAGFANFHYVGVSSKRYERLFSEFIGVKKSVKNLLSEKKEENIVCAYSLHSPFLLALLALRKRISEICVVIPDLPEYMTDKGGVLRKTAKRLDRTIIDFCLKRMDCFAVLSEAMISRLPIEGKPWTLVEGIYNPQNVPEVAKSDKTIILYTGQLQKRYGLFDLVEAFRQIPDKSYELWLCGGSSEMGWFERMVEEDNRIKLLGKLSRNEVLALQKKATLLVNPRHSNEVFTQYSFPSKTMEYLASGTPTLMCKLKSVPEEYYEHLYFFEDESVEGMRDKMMEICEKDKRELERKGREASRFILENKTPRKQVERILELINKL